MSTGPAFRSTARPTPTLSMWVLVAGLLVLGTILAAYKPVLLILLALALPAIALAWQWPESFTLGILGALYINAAAVAVRFHGVPMAVGAAIPLLLIVPIGWRWLQGSAPTIDRTGQLLVVFWLAQIFSMQFSDMPDVSLRDVMETATEGLLLYLLAYNSIGSVAVLRRVTWVLLLAGAIMGSLCLVQQVTKTYENNYGGFAQIEENAGFHTTEVNLQGHVRQRRLAGPIGSQNRFAQIMLMLVPIGMFRFWGEERPWLRIAGLGCTALIALGLMLAFSRGAAVAFVIICMVMIALGYIRARQIATIAVGLALLLLILPQFLTRMASLGALAQAAQRDSSIAEADGSLRSRLGEVVAAVFMLAEHPATGVGPGMYPHHYQHYAEMVGNEIPGVKVKEELRQPHSLYLGLGAELGLPGLLAFLAIAGCTLVGLERVRRASLRCQRPELAALAAGYFLAIVAYLATGLFLHFSYARYFWLIIAIGSAAQMVLSRELASIAARQDATTDEAAPDDALATRPAEA